MLNNLEELRKTFEELISRAENGENDYETEILELEEDVDREIDILNNHPDYEKVSVSIEGLENLKKEIGQFNKNNDFYDEERELDMMFPDRHDDDFDEDSMSYDSVFGED
ncbi:hypothetical protein CMU11_18060 [Elizabethkingia anophelis]|uniref:hypothetical protein n=1 Tax=Elizabethkingia TaxID=308865 RepID=UPI00042490CE|nr:hypothetical protein [Elizabethkingia anophelis]MDV3739000.1 hypothetical protein [Elizabethkingia anophelis]MDV3751040.1 hypothetical protein [Elizabethkingia anophelis]HAT3992466.1 hypothetical protein [Elizabethkingia anophelis]HAT3995098.1 hypothetical protein [Elizabethkingia anophelis]HAT4002814.1 hypothetical protein [Elizabethkingia anophelis]